MENKKKFFEVICKKILNCDKLTKIKLNNIKIENSKKFGIKKIIKNSSIILNCNDKIRDKIIKKLKTKPIRNSSGVTICFLKILKK